MRRGYTLLEVLVVVTILGIAGALVIPSFGQTHVLRIQAAVRTVVSDITFAQSDALAFQRPRAVMFDEDSNEYALVEVVGDTLDATANTLYVSSGTHDRYRVSMNEPRFAGARIVSPRFNDTPNLIFDEMGSPVAGPGSNVPGDGGKVDILGADSRFRINISPFTGRVTVRKVPLDDDDFGD